MKCIIIIYFHLLTLLVSENEAFTIFLEGLKGKKFENHMLFHWHFCQVILIFACGDWSVHIVTNERMMSVLIMAFRCLYLQYPYPIMHSFTSPCVKKLSFFCDAGVHDVRAKFLQMILSLLHR